MLADMPSYDEDGNKMGRLRDVDDPDLAEAIQLALAYESMPNLPTLWYDNFLKWHPGVL